MTTIVIVIDGAPGNTRMDSIRLAAASAAERLGGEVSVAMPVVDVAVPPAVEEALAMACAGNLARRALARAARHSLWRRITGRPA